MVQPFAEPEGTSPRTGIPRCPGANALRLAISFVQESDVTD